MTTTSSSDSEPLVTHIYTLHDPRTSELRYVGKTSLALAKRLQTHMSNARHATGRASHVSYWIRALDAEGMRPEIRLLQTIVGVQWVEAERFWISYFRERGCRLTNLTDGGEGVPGHRPSLETRRKLSEVNKGRVPSLETKGKLSEAAKKRDHTHLRTPEARAKAVASQSVYARNRPHEHTLAIARSSTKSIEDSKRVTKRFPDPQRPPEWRNKIGAANRGAQNGAAKLDEAKVSEIKRLLLVHDHTQSEIATMFGVSPALIRLIRLGDRWGHVPWPNISPSTAHKLVKVAMT